MNKLNKLSISLVILVGCIILGGFYYANEISKRRFIENQKETELRMTDSKITKILESKAADKSVYTEARYNADLVLVDYKLDVQNGENARNILMNTAYNSPDQMCPSIIAEKTTRKHLYYVVLDNILKLKSKYNQYRSFISYIDIDLDGLDKIIQIIKDRCIAIGYAF